MYQDYKPDQDKVNDSSGKKERQDQRPSREKPDKIPDAEPGKDNPINPRENEMKM